MCSVYPSFNVDGHKEPSQNDDHYESLKQKDTNSKLSVPPLAKKFLKILTSVFVWFSFHPPQDESLVIIYRFISAPDRDNSQYLSQRLETHLCKKWLWYNLQTRLFLLLTFHSNPPMAIPAAAAVPAIPTKCPLPMLLAKSDAPICGVHGYICKKNQKNMHT